MKQQEVDGKTHSHEYNANSQPPHAAFKSNTVLFFAQAVFGGDEFLIRMWRRFHFLKCYVIRKRCTKTQLQFVKVSQGCN